MKTDLSASTSNPKNGEGRRRTYPQSTSPDLRPSHQPVCPILGPKKFNNPPGKLRNLRNARWKKFKHLWTTTHKQSRGTSRAWIYLEQGRHELNIGPGEPATRDAGLEQRWSTPTGGSTLDGNK
ncbi:hypothetical protein GWK47_052880 [Chionoecetes opilio]|uniref:Uncharacterized protein n=1 Tax=Chionoecetes opilio TaxID=41210 RepID=A0A8J5C9F9_CHIOP|nr:hypothetical protein GWK47_052880 [Chionoecetes opilio]